MLDLEFFCFFFGVRMCGNVYGVLFIRDVFLVFVFRDFIGFSYVDMIDLSIDR